MTAAPPRSESMGSQDWNHDWVNRPQPASLVLFWDGFCMMGHDLNL